MKNTWTLLGLAGLAILVFSSSGFGQKGDDAKETPKTRHIKLMKIENGKKMELDTIVTGNDVFVWKGDTIGGKEMAKHVGSSGSEKMKRIKVIVDGDDKDENAMIYHVKNGKSDEPMVLHMESGDNDEILTEEPGDSIHKRIIIRKRMKDANDFLNDAEMKHFPPMPPMPHMGMKGQHTGRIIDLNDPNIISYRKKSLKGGREKIEIIRNKSEDPENMSFDFQLDDQLMPPPPPAPEALESIREFNGDNQKMKITEKDEKIDGKDGKEIKVKVESKENK